MSVIKTLGGQPKNLRWDCPTCDEKKSKKAQTCMRCFRNGYGKRKDHGVSVRYDKELPGLLKKAVEDYKNGRV